MKRQPHKKKTPAKKQAFWEEEYKAAGHLAMSSNPSEDLQKFMRWLERTFENGEIIPITHAADLGCGNGRNARFLSREYGITVVGFDYAHEAIEAVKILNKDFQFSSFFVHSLQDMPYPIESESCDLVLDMMASHVLSRAERKQQKEEIQRILRPGGWCFLKTFLLDEDLHARRLIKEHPGPEENSYIHPQMNIPEYVLTEQEIKQELEDAEFEVYKSLKSHKHMIDGHAAKRRSISFYIHKPW